MFETGFPSKMILHREREVPTLTITPLLHFYKKNYSWLGLYITTSVVNDTGNRYTIRRYLLQIKHDLLQGFLEYYCNFRNPWFVAIFGNIYQPHFISLGGKNEFPLFLEQLVSIHKCIGSDIIFYETLKYYFLQGSNKMKMRLSNPQIYSRSLRCNTARGSNTGLVTLMYKSSMSVLFTNDPSANKRKNTCWRS